MAEDYRGIADLAAAYARWQKMPQSQNIDDRRSNDPLAINYGDVARGLSISAIARPHQMNMRLPTSLGLQAGLDDVEDPDYYERRPQFSRQDTLSPEDHFRVNMMMRSAMLGGPSWLRNR